MPRDARRGTTNTYEPPKITYAKIQLTRPRTPAWSKIAPLWKRFHFIDITPKVDGKVVPSLNGEGIMRPGGVINKDGSIASIAGTFLKGMVKVTPDWFFISGHHARFYMSETSGEFTGFFNDHYHDARWRFARRQRHTRAHLSDPGHEFVDESDVRRKLTSAERARLSTDLDCELFLRTSARAPASMRQHDDLSPLLTFENDAARRSKCKGLILAGCNSLIYKNARLAWYAGFPESLIIGACRVINGYQLTKAIATAPMARNRKLWENPTAFFGTGRQKVKQFVEQLASRFAYGSAEERRLGLGVIYRGDFFFSHKDEDGNKKIHCRDIFAEKVIAL